MRDDSSRNEQEGSAASTFPRSRAGPEPSECGTLEMITLFLSYPESRVPIAEISFLVHCPSGKRDRIVLHWL